jgi:hypothetical protein
MTKQIKTIKIETKYIMSTFFGPSKQYIAHLEYSDDTTSSEPVTSEGMRMDEARTVFGNYGYDYNAPRYDWSHSTFDVYNSAAEYDADQWFFVQEPTKFCKLAKFSSEWFEAE